MFAFSPNQPLTDWRTKPSSGAIGAAISMGRDMTIGSAASDLLADEIFRMGRMFAPFEEELADPYVDPKKLRENFPYVPWDDEFKRNGTDKITSSRANELAELHRTRLIQQGRIAATEPGAFGTVGVMGATMLGSLLHPVDVASGLLFPESKLVAPIRAARGFIGLKAIGAGERFVASAISNALGNALLEPIVAYNEKRNLFPYTATDYAMAVTAGAVLGPVLKAGGEVFSKAISPLLKRGAQFVSDTPPEIQVATIKHMMAQVMEGRDRLDQGPFADLAAIHQRAAQAAEAVRKSPEQIRAEAEAVLRAETGDLFPSARQDAPLLERVRAAIVSAEEAAQKAADAADDDQPIGSPTWEKFDRLIARVNRLRALGEKLEKREIDAAKSTSDISVGDTITAKSHQITGLTHTGTVVSVHGDEIGIVNNENVPVLVLRKNVDGVRGGGKSAQASEIAASTKQAEADFSARIDQEVQRLTARNQQDVEAVRRAELEKELAAARERGERISDEHAKQISAEQPELAIKLFTEETAELKQKLKTLTPDEQELVDAAIKPEELEKLEAITKLFGSTEGEAKAAAPMAEIEVPVMQMSGDRVVTGKVKMKPEAAKKALEGRRNILQSLLDCLGK